MDGLPLINKMAALALAMTDAMLAETEQLAPTAVAALMTIGERDSLSIGDIAEIVGLTHSAAVRMVDRLENDGYVRRRGRVGREVMVEITLHGRRQADLFHARRLRAIAAFIAKLERHEQQGLGDLVDAIIARHVAVRPGAENQFCRMCQRAVCTCGLHDGPTTPETAVAR